jgi:hypothetical protein
MIICDSEEVFDSHLFTICQPYASMLLELITTINEVGLDKLD